MAAFRSGILYDAIHLSDLKKVNLESYKTVIFGNCYLLSDDDINYIHTNIATNGRDIVWLTAPGFTGDKGIQLKRVEKITGFSIDTMRLSDTVYVDLSSETQAFSIIKQPHLSLTRKEFGLFFISMIVHRQPWALIVKQATSLWCKNI